MSCFPWRRRRSSKAAADPLSENERRGSIEAMLSRSSSPLDTGKPPTITLTSWDKREEEEDEDEFGACVESERTWTRREMGHRKHKMSVNSDGGYSSQHSTSTLDVYRPRTLTETSGGSSTYHTPQGSVHNDPSPTTSGAMPQFAETAMASSDTQLLQEMKETLDRLWETVQRIESKVSERPGGERASQIRLPQVESLPDLTEVWWYDCLCNIDFTNVDILCVRAIHWYSIEHYDVTMIIPTKPDCGFCYITQLFCTITKTHNTIQLSLQLPSTQCNSKVVLWLVKKVTDWKFLARWLGLEEHDISRIEADYQRSDRERCYQMFLKFKSIDPQSYTYPVLGEALRRESQELFNEFVKEVHRVEDEVSF